VRELSWLLWLGIHALVSAAVMFGSALVGPSLTDGRIEGIALCGYLGLQLTAAIAIVLTASDRWKVPAVIAGVSAVMWGAWCTFLTAMALSGTWL
jgi:hypothetical protein